MHAVVGLALQCLWSRVLHNHHPRLFSHQGKIVIIMNPSLPSSILPTACLSAVLIRCAPGDDFFGDAHVLLAELAAGRHITLRATLGVRRSRGTSSRRGEERMAPLRACTRTCCLPQSSQKQTDHG